MAKNTALFKNSIVIRSLRAFGEKAVCVFHDSAFYNFFKNNCDLSDSFEKSYTSRLTGKLSRFFPYVLKTRLKFAKSCENSFVFNLFEGIYRNLLSLPLRAVGIFLLTFGLSVLLYTLRAFSLGYTFENNLIFSFICVFSSIVIMPIKKSIAECVKNSVLLRFFYSESTYLSTTFRAAGARTQSRGYSTAFFLGLLCGIFSAFTTPAKILFFAASLLLCVVFLNNPESSLLFTITIIPFLSTAYILFFVPVTLISFLTKYFRAKRHISTELSDLFMLLLALLIAFSGLFTLSGTPSNSQTIKYLLALSLYFLIKNIIRSSALSKHVLDIILSCAAVTSVINLVYALSISSRYGDILSLLTDTKPGAISIFTTPTALGVYLTAIIPLCFSQLISTGKPKHLIALLLHFTCICFASTPYAFYSSVLSIIVVLIFYNKLWLCIIPFYRVIASRFVSALSLIFSGILSSNTSVSESSASVAKSAFVAIETHPLFGIGTGRDNFSKVFPRYALASSEGAQGINSLYTSLALSLGILGFVFFVICVLQLSGTAFKYLSSNGQKDSIMFSRVAGLYGSFAALFTVSFSCYPWNDTRTLMTYVLIFSLGTAFAQSTKNDYISPHSVRDYERSCGTT